MRRTCSTCWLTRYQVKHSASSSPPPSETENEAKPITPKKPKKSTTPKSSPAKSEDGTTTSDGQWTGEKKGQLLELLIGVGLANTKPAELADQVRFLSIHAVCANKHSSE